MKNLVNFLFNESQRQSLQDVLGEDMESIWEDMAKAEDIETKAEDLIDVLKKLGLEIDKSPKADGSGFEEDASSVLFATPDVQLYLRAREIVQRPENMYDLAQAGWVGVPCGNVNTKDDGDPRHVIRFLDVSSTDPENGGKESLEKIIKKAQEYGDEKSHDTEKVYATNQPMQAKAKAEESLQAQADALLEAPETPDIRELSRRSSSARAKGGKSNEEDDDKLDAEMRRASAEGRVEAALDAESEGRMSGTREANESNRNRARSGLKPLE